MKIIIPTATPYRKKDGTWDAKIVNEEVEIPDENLGRHKMLCSYCGNKDYPECRTWCPNGDLDKE